MATTLAEEARRKQVEAFLVAGGSGDDDTGTTDQDTSDAEAADAEVAKQLEESEAVTSSKDDTSDESKSEESDKSEEPKSVAETYGDWSKWATLEQPKAVVESSSSRAAYPTIAEDQPGATLSLSAGKAFAPMPYDTSVDLFGENEKRYVTDPESGARYAVDADTGTKIPRAELATEADKQAFKPGDVTLPSQTVTATQPVRRAELIDPDPDFLYTTPDVAAPDKLTGVERGQLIGQPAPDTLPQVERGQLVNTPSGTAPRAVGRAAAIPTYPTIAEDQPGAPPAVSPPEAKPPGQVVIPPSVAAAKEIPPSTGVQGPTVPPPSAQELNINTDYSAQRGSYHPGRAGDGKIQGIVLHSSDGTEKSGINQLTTGGVSAHYFVTKDGRIYQFVNDNDTAYHAGKVVGPYNNSNTIGIEQEHYDPDEPGKPGPGGKNGEAWSQPQVEATARLVASLKAKYGLSDDNIMGHSNVAPGRKQDPYNYPWQHFFSSVDGYSGGQTAEQPPKQGWESWQTTQAKPGEAPKAVSATGDQITIGTQKGFYPDENPAKWATGNATTFGGPDDVAKFQAGKAAGLSDKEARLVGDEGVGSPWFGKLSTNNNVLQGVAIPEAVLRNNFGKNYAAMRQARVDIVDLTTGQRMRVPIVDVGPRDTSGGVVTDMTTATYNAFGGDTGHKYALNIVPNAGADVLKNPQDFWNEQAAIRKNGDISAPSRQAAQKPAVDSWQTWATLSPAEQLSVDTAKQYQQRGQIDTLDELNRNTENPGQFWKILDQPMPGTVDPASGKPVGAVSDAARTTYRDNFKQELTKYAQDFYGEPDPNKAFQRAVGDANFGTFGQDVGRAATGVVGQVDVGINKMSRDSDNNALDRFAQVLHPESDGPGRAAFIKTITDIQDPALRAQTIGKLWANLDPEKQAAIDINGLVNSADNVANPVFQAGQAREIAAKDAFIQKLFTPDPTLRGTAGAWATPTGQVLGNIALTALPRMLQASAFASQIYGATRDRVKEEHPDWPDEQIASNSGISTIAQLAPQEALMALSHGIIGPIARWATNPVARFGIGGGIHLATGAAGGALMQAGANVVEGQPITQDVGEAAKQGAIQAVPFAVHGALSGALTPREVAPAPEVNKEAPLGQEPVTPPPATGKEGAPVRGATTETLESQQEETPPPEATGTEPVQPPPVIHPSDIEPTPDQTHIDLNTLADMSDLPDEQSRAEALAAIRQETPVQQTGAAEAPVPVTHDPELLRSYRSESDEDLASAYAASKDPVARQVLAERYPDNRLPLEVQDILNPDLAAKRAKAIADAGAVSEQAARAETAQEAQAPEGKEHLLQALVKSGGLPNPARLKTLADKGEVLTGEVTRLHDAWKALPLDAKKSLGNDGVTFNKLFSRSADPLDITRGNLAQHPDGYAYGTSGEMLDEVDRALALAAQGRRVYGGGGLDYTGGGEFGEKISRIAGEDASAGINREGRGRAGLSELGGRGNIRRTGQLHDVSEGLAGNTGASSIDWADPHNAEHFRRANQVREEIRPAVEALGAQLTGEPGRNYARLRESNRGTDFRVNLDPEKLAGDSIRAGLNHAQSLERMRSVADEELIHAADLLTLHRDWSASDPRSSGSFRDYLINEGNQATAELFNAYDNGTPKTKKFLRDVVEAAYNAYHFRDETKRQVKFDEIRRRLEADPTAALEMRAEFVRQLIQAQRRGNITELVPPTLIGRLTNWLRKTIATLRQAYSRVRGGEAGATMARVLRKTQAELDALGSIWRGRVAGEGGEFGERPESSDFALEIQKAKAARILKPAVERGKPAEFRFDQPEGFRLEQETTGGAPVPEALKPAAGEQGTFSFGERPETPKLAEDKIRELNSSTFKPMDGRRRSWETFVGLLRGFHSMVPEAGAKGASEGTIKIQQWERYLKGLGPKVKTDSANIIRKVLDPVLKVSTETHPELIDNLSKLNDRIKARELAGKPVPTKWTDARANLEKIQNSNPLHLFQQAVLYRDLYFRSQVKVGTDIHGNPRYMQLPMGLTKDEVINKLVDLKNKIRMLTPEQQAGVKESLRSHYRLVRDIKDELAARGFVIPKELTNPYYYPHQLLEHMSGHLGSPRITTQEDFRNYLINPVGSEKPIETNYVKAMLQHLVEVRSHNARADATEQYLEGIDKSAKYKRQVAEENNRRIDATGSMKNLLPQNEWERRARADGLEIYTAQKRLPLRMEAMLDLKAISKRIGQNIEGPHIAQQLRKLGVQINAEDVRAAMSTTDPVKWALHPKEIEALEGILGRNELASKAGHGWGNRFMNFQRGAMQNWKWWHLFSPTSAIRYNYNLMAVDLEKAATVDPAIFKKLGPALKEVRQFMATGKYTSPEMESAVEHDVVHSPTAHELNKAHEFPQLHGLVAPESKGTRLMNAVNLGAKFAGIRDRTFRYAKYLADLDRLRAGQSVPEVALHRDLEAEPTLESRAAKNAREMFVDYSAISPAGESLRKNAIPFYSWMEGNFRYHANLFRNFHDMSVPNKAEFIGKMAPRYLAKAVFGRATRGFLLRAAMVNGGLAAWNAWQMQQNHIKDSDLSDEDKRHLFIITGKDPKTGKVSLMYVPTASSDIASWLGGSHFAKAFMDYTQGRADLGHAVQHWMQGAGADIVNKVASSIRPEVLGGVGALSHQDFFPNVMKPRPIPGYDWPHQMVKTIFDAPTADAIESMRNNKFLPSKSLGEHLSQMILQQRARDPQQENYYAAKDRVDQFMHDKQRDRTPGTSENEQTAVVRNLRKSMYNGNVSDALKFANILVNEYGYNSQKFAASLKAQNPLAALPADLKKEYMAQLSDFDKEQLADAYRYTARLQTDKPNAQAEARAIFGPAKKPVLNQQALRAAILAMQDETKRAATAQQLQQKAMAMPRGR
jgi:N-acetyl-anhydromuramyl-L-alanine amidase AmpD